VHVALVGQPGEHAGAVGVNGGARCSRWLPCAADEDEARSNAGTVLGEVVKAEPDERIVKRGVTMLKGCWPRSRLACRPP